MTPEETFKKLVRERDALRRKVDAFWLVPRGAKTRNAKWQRDREEAVAKLNEAAARLREFLREQKLDEAAYKSIIY
jgi:hypothetical protein